MRITLNADPRSWSTKALATVPDPGTDEGWRYWLEHSKYTDDSRDDAIRRYDPAGRMRADADFVAAYWTETCDGHWTCDAYDPEHGACTAHEQRPPLCRDYPWYGEPPSADRAGTLYRQCSYLADLPPDQRPEGARPLLPLTVISH
jgi:hypothetical protein